VTRFQKLAAATVVTAILLVTIGVVVRATGSGTACPTWPGCFEGQFLPTLDNGAQAWIEWVHRTVAVIIGFEVLGLAILAFLDHRDRRTLLAASLGAVLLVGFQAWLGRETVRLGNSGESVTAHLASAMALVGLLVWIFVRSLYPARLPAGGTSQRFTIVAAFGAASVFALLLFGSHVTATSQWYVFPDWPLMNGTLLPTLTDGNSAHVLHRWVAVVVGLIVAAVFVAAWRIRPRTRPIIRLAAIAAILFPIQAIVGGLQILTGLSGWTQTLHLALGAVIWSLLVGLVTVSYLEAASAARVAAPEGTGPAGSAGLPGERTPQGDARHSTVTTHTRRDTVRSYIALTKPRIIELLLVTTVPAMVLATRQVPGIQLGHWAWLTVWTLVGGTLAAGSANAINCYLDRDIDLLMARTRRRPLPAHEVEPERAVLFGLALGAISFAVLAFFVNVLAAFLGLLAIAFYVVIYTMLLKRTSPQNIVIGGAAGALPPVIGWAAVTGNVGVPALILFALVFYWTPPHFWALSLRIRKDYAAAGVPMLPVVRGVPETTRQIGLYTILMVAISLVLFAVARMGPIYLAAALILGGLFLRQAWQLWRRGSSEEESTAGAIRLYRYSISYLTLLFAAIALDTLVLAALG
jgi:protoheme IX farnesyltransferase